jgi:hypothetical protein
MKNKVWVVSGLLVAAYLVCIGGSAARAQDSGSKFDVSAMYSYTSFNLGNSACGGEDFIECFGDPGLQGAKIAGVWKVGRHVGVECNLSYHAGTHTVAAETGSGFQDVTRERDDVTTYLCGPKLTMPVGSFEIFTHLLAGGMHVSTGGVLREEGTIDEETALKGTIFGMEVGGGVDWVHNHWGIRLLEVDYVHGTGTVTGRCTFDFCSEGGETIAAIGSANDLQIAMGVNFRFGKR